MRGEGRLDSHFNFGTKPVYMVVEGEIDRRIWNITIDLYRCSAFYTDIDFIGRTSGWIRWRSEY